MSRQLNTRLVLKTAAVLSLAALLSVLIGRFLHQAAASRVLPKARELAAHERYDEALKLFEVHLEALSGSEAELVEYAHLLAKSARREALHRLPEVYRKILKANPSSWEALQKLTEFSLAAARMRIRFSPDAPTEWAEAAKLARRMIEVAPEKAEGQSYLGRALLGMGQFAEARATFAKLVAAHPEEEEAYFYLAEATERSGGAAEEARKCVDQALASNPQSPSVHLKAYGYFAARRDEDRAGKLLSRALELGPDRPEVLATAAIADEREGRPDAATPHWQKLRAVAPTDPTSYVALARIARAKGDWKGALAALDEGLKQCEKNKAELHFQAASILLDLGRRKETGPHLEYLRATAPRALLTDLLEGLCSLADGRLDGARHSLERAGRGLELVTREFPPLSKANEVVGRRYLVLVDCYSLLHKCYSSLGTCYVRLGEPGAAIKAFSEVVRLWPASTEARLNLARALLLAQDADGAREQAKEATNLAQDQKRQSPEAWLTLALADWALAARPGAPKSLLDDAVTAAQKAVDARADARGLILLAQLLAEAGKLAQAEAALKRDPADPKDAATLQIARVAFYASVAKPPDLAKADQEHKNAVEKQGETLELKLDRVLLLSPKLTFEGQEKALQGIVATAGPGGLPQARAALARFYAKHGKVDKAVEQLKAIAKAEPDNAAVRRFLLRLAFDSGDTGDAKALVDQLVKIEGPDSHQVICDRAELALTSAGQDDERKRIAKEVAEKTLEPLRREASSWRAFALSGDAYQIQGKLPEAVDCYLAGFRANPASVRLGVLLVRALEAAGRPQEANVIRDRLAASAPESPVVLSLQLERLQRDDNLDGLLAMLRQRLDAQPNALLIVLNLGNALLAKREFAQAEAQFRKAYDLAPRDPVVLDRLASVLRQTGKQEESLELCNELVAASPDQPQAYLFRAKHFAACGEHQKALADFECALKRADKQHDLRREILISLGDLTLEHGESEPALAWYRKAAESERQGTFARKYLVERLIATGRQRHVAEARALVDAVLEETPNDPPAHLLMARIAALDPETFSLAKEHCRRAVELAPKFAQPHTQLSLIHQAEGDLRLAAEEASRAVSCDPRSLDALLRYAESLRRQKRADQAREVLQRARAIHPSSVPVALTLAAVAGTESGSAKAEDCLKAADFLKDSIASLSQGAESEAGLRLGMAWYLEKAGKTEEAETQLRTACKLRKNSFDTLSALAGFLERRKRSDESDRLVDDAAKGASGAQLAAVRLVRADLLLARQRGPSDLAEAERLAKAVLASAPESPRSFLILGDVAAARKDTENAIALYRKALEFDCRNARAANNLAWALHQAGNPKEALPLARRAVALDDANPGFRDTLGQICYGLRLYSEAERSFALCVEMSPTSASAHHNLGRALAELGKREPARDALGKALQLGKEGAALSEEQRTDITRLIGRLVQEPK